MDQVSTGNRWNEIPKKNLKFLQNGIAALTSLFMILFEGMGKKNFLVQTGSTQNRTTNNKKKWPCSKPSANCTKHRNFFF